MLAFSWTSRYGMSNCIEHHTTLYTHNQLCATDVTTKHALYTLTYTYLSVWARASRSHSCCLVVSYSWAPDQFEWASERTNRLSRNRMNKTYWIRFTCRCLHQIVVNQWREIPTWRQWLCEIRFFLLCLVVFFLSGESLNLLLLYSFELR